MRLISVSLTIAAALLCASLPGCASGFIPAMPAPATYHEVRAGTKPVRLAVRETGKGKPILLLHGLGASSYTWRAITPQLAKTHRVIALDLKGFGDSEKPLDDAYSIADQAKLVRDYIVRNDLRDLTLVGHSFGGGVALAVALDEPERPNPRIERLVLINSLAYRQPVPFFFRVLRTPIIGALGLNLIPLEVQISQALAVAYYHDWKVNAETVTSYASPLQGEGGKHALLSTVQSLMNEDADAYAARYRSLKTRALLIWCDHDRIVPLSFGKRLARDLPNAEVEIIEECGHIPQEEQPAETWKAIQGFAVR